MNPIYFTDEYPRQGCTAGVDVTKHGFTLSIHAPCGHIMEVYHAKTSRGICRMLEEWCNGFKPASHHCLDQLPSASGSTVTE